jgi:hypothetical protein
MFSVIVNYLLQLKHNIILTKCTPVTAVKINKYIIMNFVK